MARSHNNARYVIDRMEVAELQRVYVLGCGAKRVTVLSQQYRAFNLIWALFSEGRLKSGDRVGIVGGGIGGITTAAAAMLKGCNVVLVEERADLMHLQRQNRTRLLHPNIYEWPHRVAEDSATQFPCMNWSADMAGGVVAKLDGEWAAMVAKHSPKVHTSTRITGIEPQGPEGRVVLASADWESSPCDVVILAVGFGVEGGSQGVAQGTYWENDNLEQPVRGPQGVKRYFVSGNGDGGCIDVLRLTYTNFNHVSFVAKVVRLKELQALRGKLLRIDSRMPPKDQSTYIHDEYSKLAFPTMLAAQLGTFRTDTYVELNGTDPFPYSHKACILHRVALWGLAMADHLIYRPGALDRTKIAPRPNPNGLRYMVPVPGRDGRDAFDTVVLRHGPQSWLATFPTVVSGYKGIKDNPAIDRTRRQLYPDDFYPSQEAVTVVPRGEAPTMALAHARNADQEFSTPPNPPLMAELVIDEPVPSARVQAGPPPSIRQDRIVSLTRTVATETKAQNYPDALDAASVLESLLVQPSEQLQADVWEAAHTALSTSRSSREGGQQRAGKSKTRIDCGK